MVTIIALIVGGIIIYRRSRKRDLDTTPRDKTGQAIEPEDEDYENDPSQAPIYDDDLTYDDWNSWEDLLAEIGIIDIRDGMIEYETGDNSRLFVMLAEMGQSNPYLKTNEELAQNNQIMEVFFNGVLAPIKISSQSQKIVMTDFLKDLAEHSKFIHGTNDQMRDYADRVIRDTLDYQQSSDRFENKCYVQFQAVIKADEVFGETPAALEKQIHEKAMEKLLRQITRADGLLKRADHSLSPLDTFGLLEVLYKTFNRESSVRVRLEDIIKKQRYSLFTSAYQNDTTFKHVQQKVQIEADAINMARESLQKQQDLRNAELLSRGEDYYQSASDDDTTSDSLV
ncbi:hypothetical protein FOD75_11320 (plasmid) [Limosilactobacillus reuteri]|uniref:Uncharacterized protein n=1 Tax=Limosilactobacillus reuteri TaxID=1598 RepID=A0A517D8M1_LIMRT|nr:hypothetical protein [Limosilactobacillus reuteri]QDR73674.1 hypothetical protein FOD75_11320 [Limosilactobacillus reuteri]